MKTQSFLLGALAAVPYAFAHTVFTGFYVNGVPQGDAVAMRMASDPATCSNPLSNLESQDLACNVGGTKGVSRVQSVPDGAKLSFEIRAWPSDPTQERLDRRHYGPCAVYLKKVDSAINDTAAGDGWFKIFAEGYDSSSKLWCTDKIIDNNGLLTIALPQGLQGGYYLARPEILALHKALENDPQFYTGCAQIFLESTGELGPESTVSIPGYVKKGEESTSFDIYSRDLSEYTLPGPDIAKLSAQSSIASATEMSQTEGLKPEGCIVENGEWCGKEIPSYSDEKGCWLSDADCWKQSEDCYNMAPVTGQKGCDIWQAKCTENQSQCKSGYFNGPPNEGKVLTPQAETIDVGPILAPVSGNVASTPPNGDAEAKIDTPSESTPSAVAPSSNSDYTEQEHSVNSEDTEEPAQNPSYPAITPAAALDASGHKKGRCPKGFKCVTSYTISPCTKIEYKTVDPDMKKRSLHHRRHGHRF